MQRGSMLTTQADRGAPCLCSNALLIITLGDDGDQAAYEVLHPDINEPLVSGATSHHLPRCRTSSY